MLTPSLQRELKYTATVKSHPPTGVRGGPTVSFEIPLTAIDSAAPYVAERGVVESPYKLLQAYTYTNQQITTGMFLQFGGKEYSIKGVAPFPEPDGFVLYQMYFEDLNAK